MARRKEKQEDQDIERMTAAMRRLEDLLQDPASRIAAKPKRQRARDDDDPVKYFEPELAAGVVQINDEPADELDDGTQEDAAECGLGSVRPRSEASQQESAWADRLGSGPEIPPPRTAQKRELKIELPQGMRPGIKKPPSSSGGVFRVFLSWLPGPHESEFKVAVSASRRALGATFLFSAVINILMLAGPVFLLQVYDRVLPSGSLSTLITLAIITACIYCIAGILELTRSRIISRIGTEIDQRLSDRVFEAALRKRLATQRAAGSALHELDRLRQFMSSAAPITLCDIPWTPIYLTAIFLTHWTLGVAALVGSVILLGLASLSEQRGRLPLRHAMRATAKRSEMGEAGQHNAEAITAMGMLGAYRARWQTMNGENLGWQLLASDRLGDMSSITKAVRPLLQSLMLAIAAGLAIKGEISPGAMIAATIIFGRALAPIEHIIGHWRDLIKVREAIVKLDEVLAYAPIERNHTELPRPNGELDVQNIRVAAPETRSVILNGISFKVSPGQSLAIIGPSGSGKSTIVRAIVGVWPPFGGMITLDNVQLDRWHPQDLGRYIGYLPQNVELFCGTVKENIARFHAGATSDHVVEAAKQARAHEMILRLPNGYETELDAGAALLSAGQRQRIALARALFGRPPLVVLDEPYANLDSFGDEALSETIESLRQSKQTVIVVSHRTQAIDKADLLLLIGQGQQRAFGPRIEIMKLCEDEQPVRDATEAEAPLNPPASTPKNAKPPPSEKRRPRRKRDAP